MNATPFRFQSTTRWGRVGGVSRDLLFVSTTSASSTLTSRLTILLDNNFNPKISDLYACKVVCKGPKNRHLNSRKRHNGYIAPELYSPSFGRGHILQVRCVQFRHAGVRNGEREEKIQTQVPRPRTLFTSLSGSTRK
jgi:hypothetical protein